MREKEWDRVVPKVYIIRLAEVVVAGKARMVVDMSRWHHFCDSERLTLNVERLKMFDQGGVT